MATFFSIVAALLVIAAIVLIHEAGHFAAARLVRIPVNEFSIGFGPKLFSWRRNDITYSLRAIPMGGYVRFFGDEEEHDEFAYGNYNVYKRIFVSISGIIANIISAILLAIVVQMVFGVPMGVSTTIRSVDEGGPAQLGGIIAGDIITEINGLPCETGSAISLMIGPTSPSQTVDVTLLRGGEVITVQLQPFYDEVEQRSRIGVTMKEIRERLSFVEAASLSTRYVLAVSVETLNALKSAVFRTGEVQGEMMGIVGTVSVVSEGVRDGWETVLMFACLISVNVALINFLPLPAVDGGKLIFLFIEAVRRRPINPEKEGMVHFIGIILFLGLTVLLIYKDILRLITGG